jgi:Holliday junction resolvasome RuvABC endonuclease subunit
VVVLSLDLSTKSGWALFENGKYKSSGALERVSVVDFNVNDFPNKSPSYPFNVLDAAEKVCDLVRALLSETNPDHIVVENTVKGQNRHTQRILEFCHYAVLTEIRKRETPLTYMDPSEWRSIVQLRLTSEDKKNNKEVSKGKKRGRIGKKHLSVRFVKELFGIDLKLKNNDEADAILLAHAFSLTHQSAT